MNNRPRILDSRGNPLMREARPVRVRGRYDAAQISEETRRHWSEADSLSARAANSTDVRLKLRTRARYEAANNSYAAGIVSTLANDLIGTGPRLQLLGPDPTVNREIEAAFCDWCACVDLAQKLRTMRRARAVDGEAFLFFDSDPSYGDIQLDLRLYEADQVATPYPYPLDPCAVDGIRFNRRMKPIEYHLLKAHPGDDLAVVYSFDFEPIPARYVIHWFKPDRPGQYRGIPDLTPALPLFAQLRRYTLAVLAAAETAADFAAFLFSELPPDADATDAEPFETLEIEKRMLTTLPAGWKMAQLKAEQPTSTYESFKREIINEIARSMNVPYNIAAGNSSSYNYSSGRLDHQTYYRSLKVERSQLEVTALDRILAEWIAEARRSTDLIPDSALVGECIPHRWLWLGMEHVDPEKEANAQRTRLESFTTTWSDECQAQGVDPEARVQTIANDVRLFEEYGLPSPYGPKNTPAPAAPAQPMMEPPDPEDGGDGNADPTSASHGRQNGRAFYTLAHRNGHLRP